MAAVLSVPDLGEASAWPSAHRLGQHIQRVDELVNRVAPLTGLGPQIPQHRPEPPRRPHPPLQPGCASPDVSGRVAGHPSTGLTPGSRPGWPPAPWCHPNTPPTITSAHSRSSSSPALKCTPSTYTSTKSLPYNDLDMNARCSSCRWRVSRLTTDALSPAAEPKNLQRGTKSRSTTQCRGQQRQHLGDLRRLAAPRRRDAPAKSHPWPAVRVDPLVTEAEPGPASRSRLSPWRSPAAGNDRCGLPDGYRAHRPPQPNRQCMPPLGLNAAASIHRAPSRQISYKVAANSPRATSSVAAFNIGVLPRRRANTGGSFRLNEEGIPRP